MRRVEAPCPGCGAPVTFKTGSGLVTICEFCHSAVARTDRALEDLGKVAAIAPTESAFYLGQTGRFRDRKFEVVGHVRYQHPAGGTWEEWYAAFPGDKWLWLAEAQGKIYATQEKRLPSELAVPAFESLTAGQSIALGSHGTWIVAEVNEAAVAGAEGELPYVLRPGAPHRFADLTSSENVFATLDFSGEKPRLFGGREITVAELGLSGPPAESEPVVATAAALNCPKCGGSLSLRAPDEAQRVTCPFCSSLLDITEGALTYLFTLGKKKIEPLLPLGREGTLSGVKYTVIGFLRRAVRFDREYTWDEYLLYAPKVGFRWLVHSDMHWSFVEPLTLGSLANRSESSLAYEGRSFKLFQRAWARVKYVLGEFYWKVSFDETVLAEDYIAPPQMITIERTPTALVPKEQRNHQGSNFSTFAEVNVSLGTYVTHDTVEQAFSVANLPRGWAVAPNQPIPGPKSVYGYWMAFLVLVFVIEAVLSFALSRPVDHGLAVIAVVLVSIVPGGMALYNHQFNVRRWEDSEYSPYASDDDD